MKRDFDPVPIANEKLGQKPTLPQEIEEQLVDYCLAMVKNSLDCVVMMWGEWLINWQREIFTIPFTIRSGRSASAWTTTPYGYCVDITRTVDTYVINTILVYADLPGCGKRLLSCVRLYGRVLTIDQPLSDDTQCYTPIANLALPSSWNFLFFLISTN